MPKTPVLLKWIVAALLVTTLAVQGVSGVRSAPPNNGARSAISLLPDTDWSVQDSAIRQAVAQAVNQRNDVPAFVVFDIRVESIDYSRAGDQALVWVAMVEKKTGQVLATEPGLFLAYRAPNGWQFVLPGDPDWQSRLEALPTELLTEQIRSNFLSGFQQPQTSPPIGGFYLPWAAGRSKWLTMAANHVSCLSKCRYATDWADGTHFSILAARGGAMFGFKDTCEDNDHQCTNYLVVKDSSTSPESYQIYFHLAHDSIPAALKVINPANPPQVLQGQFIANADNTGYSTGSHLHFMVVTDPFYCTPQWCNGDSYWWGTSVDITFKDVFTNWDTATQGGRPCTEDDFNHGLCAEWQSTYTSGNMGASPFTGGITQPADRTTITNPNLQISGWAASDMGVTWIKVIVNDYGIWREVGDAQTDNPFSMSLDVCAAGIPDGVFDLALRAWDGSGNWSTIPIGLRHLAKDTHCTPPPAPAPLCVPGANQAALFSLPNFGGLCVVLGQGNYPSAAALAPLSEHGVASLQVGQNVKAILFSGANFTERQETFVSADHNLADNRVSSQQVSSLKVVARTTPPAALTVLNPIPGPGGSPLTSIDSVVLAWGRADGAVLFQTRLFQGVWDCSDPNLPAPYMARQPDDFLPSPSWSLGTLPESTTYTGGKYSLCVRMRAPGTEDSMWYGRKFVVIAGTLPETAILPPPYNDDMENQNSGWTASGLWHWISDPRNGSPNHSWAFNNTSGDYAGEMPAFGDLTSPLINLPASGSYFLRFDYRYQTEASTLHWDQRWLQISKDGGRFENLLQLSDEGMASWLRSPFINLSAYTGSTIRLRFHFDSIDTYYNAGLAGWFIDNVTLNNTPPPSGCNEPVPNDTIETAAQINYGQTVTADICPAGDVDFYKITAVQGDVLLADIDAQTLNPPSQMTAVLDLFVDGEPTSVLAESIDELPGMQFDPYLGFVIPQAGIYYLRVKDRNYPSQGSPAYNYTLKVQRGGSQGGDTTDPTISLTNPTPGLAWRQVPQVITALASDNTGGSGMQRVDFLWHPVDWSEDLWLPLYTDWNGANGWNALLDVSQLPEGQTIGIAARAVDWAGNVSLAVDFDVVIDSTPPVVNFTGELPTEDTALLLRWDASDAASGIAYFSLEVNRDASGWQPVDTHLPGDTRQAWFIGEFGHSYQFRLRAVDFANNESAFAQTGTTLTTCQPDTFETPTDDDSLANAKDLPLEVSQPHNFCGVADQDWVKFTPQAGQKYLLWAVPDPGNPAAPVLGLYKADGTRLMEASSAGYGQWAMLKWVAPDNDTYYLRANSLNPAIAGTHITYRLWAGEGRYLYFAYIAK